MHYNKLVRDKIISSLKKKGLSHSYHAADSEEYWLKLKEKLTEEIQEFQQSESIEELADIFEVLSAVLIEKGIKRSELESVRRRKKKECGGFEQRYILESVKD